MSEIIIYHHNDMDGRAAAAIVNYWNSVKAKKYVLKFVEMDYNKDVDVSVINPNEKIVIVDFSFKPEVMRKVLAITTDVIWIDHHKTAAEYDYGRELNGLRNFLDKAECGAELAWRFFFPVEPIPEAIKRIGDYDTWRNSQGDSLAFYEGAKMLEGIESPISEIWHSLFCANFSMIREIIEQGYTAIKYREAFSENFCKSFGYEAVLDGHKCYVANLFSLGSKVFGERMKQYDFCCTYVFNGKKYIISLYAETGFDVSEIAKAHGGGGHKGASGFVADTLPFI